MALLFACFAFHVVLFSAAEQQGTSAAPWAEPKTPDRSIPSAGAKGSGSSDVSSSTTKQQTRCNSTDETLLEELECLEPKEFRDAGDPAWAWVGINGVFAVAIMILVPLCCFCSLKVARGGRELRQFRAPLQEEVMELSETSLGVVEASTSARRGLADQASTGPYAPMHSDAES